MALPNAIVQEFWQGNYTVLVNGQAAESKAWTDESDTYVYFTYENSEEVVIIPELPSFLVMQLFVAAILAFATVSKRKRARALDG
jgi:hypothetical protein